MEKISTRILRWTKILITDNDNIPKTVEVRFGAGVEDIDSGLMGWIEEFLLFILPSSSLIGPDFDCYKQYIILKVVSFDFKSQF